MSESARALSRATVTQATADVLLAATVARDVTGSDGVLVTVDGDLLESPAPYPKRGDRDPHAGDQCLIAFDQDGRPWVIAWDINGWGT